MFLLTVAIDCPSPLTEFDEPFADCPTFFNPSLAFPTPESSTSILVLTFLSFKSSIFFFALSNSESSTVIFTFDS